MKLAFPSGMGEERSCKALLSHKQCSGSDTFSDLLAHDVYMHSVIQRAPSAHADTYISNDVLSIEESIVDHVEYTLARSRIKFDNQEAYQATALSLRDRLIESWNDTQQYFKCGACPQRRVACATVCRAALPSSASYHLLGYLY